MDRSDRDLGRADQVEPVLQHAVGLLLAAREEPGARHHLVAHEQRRVHGGEPLADHVIDGEAQHRVLQEREVTEEQVVPTPCHLGRPLDVQPTALDREVVVGQWFEPELGRLPDASHLDVRRVVLAVRDLRIRDLRHLEQRVAEPLLEFALLGLELLELDLLHLLLGEQRLALRRGKGADPLRRLLLVGTHPVENWDQRAELGVHREHTVDGVRTGRKVLLERTLTGALGIVTEDLDVEHGGTREVGRRRGGSR
jgi:hypothetical protein